MPLPYPKKISLGHFPTPVEKLAKLSEKLGVELYVKRDDLTGMELSGNKVRKLEYLLCEALDEGADTIITCGGLQSNHCRATAAASARLGLNCHLILRSETSSQPYDGNLFLDKLFGAEVSFVSPDEFVENEDAIIEDILKGFRAKGRKPFYFPVGASVPMGCWGYVEAFEETVGQLDAMGIGGAHFVTAVGSGGTQTGLVLGRALMNRPEFKITGFNVCDTAEYFKKENAKLLRETIERFSLPVSIEEQAFDIIDGYVGPGYAMSYPEEIETIKMVARREGLVLDPVYTGKAFHGLLSEIAKGTFSKDEPIVFFHTGGIFGLFPQRDAFLF